MEFRKRRLLKKLRSLDHGLIYHVCVLYPDKANCHVRTIRYFVERCLRMRVFDREIDGHPGQHVFQMGIETSKMTLLFITKEFLEDGLLMHGAMSAVMKFVTSRGKHRVIPILLEYCKIPHCLRVLHYIPVWKYQHNTDKYSWNEVTYQHQLAEKIIKAFIGPPPDYRKVKKIGRKQVFTRNTKAWKNKFKCISNKMQENLYKPTLPRSDADIKRLVSLLGKVVLVCPFGKCRFACRGCFYQNMYMHHEHVCLHIPRKCEYCSYKAPRKLLTRHSQNCSYRPEKVQDFSWLHSDESEQEGSSARSSKELPEVDAVKAQAKTRRHKRNIIKPTDCRGSRKTLPNNEQDIRSTRTSPLQRIQCANSGCQFIGTLTEIDKHRDMCQYRSSPCKHEGCTFEGENVNEIENHMMSCEYRTVHCDECEECFQFLNQQDHKCKLANKLKSKLVKFLPHRKRGSDDKNSEKHNKNQQTMVARQTSETDSTLLDTYEIIITPDDEELSPTTSLRQPTNKPKTPQTFDRSHSTTSSRSSSSLGASRQTSNNATGESHRSLNRVAESRNKFNSLGSSLEDEDLSISSLAAHRHDELHRSMSTPYGLYS